MEIDREYKLWKACDQAFDGIRGHVLIERLDGNRGRAIALDGYVAVVVPVTLDDDDIPGLLYGHLLKKGTRLSGYGPAVVRLGEETVTFEGHLRSLTGQRMMGNYEAKSFPDVSMPLRHVAFGAIPHVSIQWRLLKRVCLAMGIDYSSGGPILRFGDTPESPIVVQTFDGGRVTEYPFGLIMPMKADGAGPVGELLDPRESFPAKGDAEHKD